MPPGASNSEQGGTNRPPGSPRPRQLTSPSDLEDSPAPFDAQTSTSQQTGASRPLASPQSLRSSYASIIGDRPVSPTLRSFPELPHSRPTGSPGPAVAQPSTSQQTGASGTLAAPRPLRPSYASILRDRRASSSPSPRPTHELPHGGLTDSPGPALPSSPPIVQGRSPRLG